MVRKAIVTFAWVLIASLALAQTTTKRTRHYRTTTAITSVEGVLVTAPTIASEGGSVASYQPSGTLVVRTDSANPERFDLPGPGLVYDKFGRPTTAPIKPGRGACFLRGLGPSTDDRSRSRVRLTKRCALRIGAAPNRPREKWTGVI